MTVVSEKMDKFNNLILTATWNGRTLEKIVDNPIKAKKKMISQFRDM